MPGGADLVCYWFSKAATLIREGKLRQAGLVATNSIRGGANRSVLEDIRSNAEIFEAWSDEPWTLDSAAVRVSLICFHPRGASASPCLDGRIVPEIFSNLSSGGIDVTEAGPLSENLGIAFIGTQKSGPFDIGYETAREWLTRPSNPNGRPNSDVIRPWVNGRDITSRPQGHWIIDFGPSRTEAEAAFYEAPFHHVVTSVKPMRADLRRDNHRLNWWRHGEARPGLRRALAELHRFIATPRVAKHRLFVWLDIVAIPDSRLTVVARDDDVCFGILHSRFDEAWSLATCSWHGVGNDPTYNAESCFETFPFPSGLTPNIPSHKYAVNPRGISVGKAARELCKLREHWLNPPDFVRREKEVVPGFPDRLLPVDATAAAILKTRTLTNLYNERPAWLANAHRDLDAAVATAYGWPTNLSQEEALSRLLALSLERAAAGR